MFLQAEGASHITTELALRWATRPAEAEPVTWAYVWASSDALPSGAALRNLSPRFHLQIFSPHHYRRKPPYIYSDEEIERLLCRTQQLASSKGLRARTFTTLFGLLAVTGMRMNEALGLDRTGC